MDYIIANVDGAFLKIETELNEQIGWNELPFTGMDKSTSAVCNFFNQGKCEKEFCPFRHIKAEQKTIVCKHWLRALCKKGDSCEFLHEYDMSKMPECYFFSKYHACHKKECTFLHIDPESKIKDCAWYDRGFCRHGPICRHRHVRRVLCKNYLAGFCPDGQSCKFMHPRFELPPASDPKDSHKRPPQCHFCSELGHKMQNCPKISQEQREIERLNNIKNSPYSAHHNLQKMQKPNTGGVEGNSDQQQQQQQQIPPQQQQHHNNPPPTHRGHFNHHHNQNGPRAPYVPRKLEDITCFKCGMKGHYANRCYSFLNNSVDNNSK
ncbi:hypothetical protein PVAND_011474 [Polypedilum vanderplanki]|uniref:Cleavage and polyadenylation specificity factor subunit 4 n=1 Tax=Polypedilum vanderplanki TaxID=319348 RepID=A0A9J6CJP8_POLVA|nr:hypothetical protein PVAND_011474 [Polypedilum vanderplanki]